MGSRPTYYIESGDSKKTIELSIPDDTTYERHSKVEMKIVADTLYDIDSDAGVTYLLVEDNEFLASTAALSASSSSVAEGAGSATVTVTVTTTGTNVPHGSASVTVTSADGTAKADSDYTALKSTLTFAESDFSQVTVNNATRYRASKTASVSITQDTDDEDSETFDVSMSVPSDSPITRDSDATSVTITITDDDDPLPTLTTLSVSDGTLTPTFSASTLSYTVANVGYGTSDTTITASAGSDVTVSFRDSDGDSLSDSNTTKTGHQVALGIGDTTVKVRASEGGQSQDYTIVFTRAKPTVSIKALTTSPAKEGDKIQFEISRSVSAADSLTVTVKADEKEATTDAGYDDILPSSVDGKSVEYTIAANATKKTIELQTTEDSTYERHSKIEATIESDDHYTIASNKGTASLIVKDDEFVASTAALAVSSSSVGEGGGSITVTVTVTTTGTNAPHGSATIKVSSANGTATAGSDYTALDSTLTFAEADFSQVTISGTKKYQASQTATLSITQDTVDEDSETLTVSMAAPSDSLITRDSAKTSATVTITDDDIHLSSLSVGDGTLTPAFSAPTFSYTIPSITYGTSSTTIKASAKSGVDVSIRDSDGDSLSDLDTTKADHQVALGIGDTTIKVRATEGSQSQDYTLVFTRTKPTVSIKALTTSPAVEGDKIQFEISRSVSAADSLTVTVKADELDATPNAGHDDILPSTIEGESLTYTIAPNKTKKTIELQTNGDSTYERHSKIEATIESKSHYSIASNKGTASLIVQDDEFVASTAALSVSASSVGEGEGSITVTVTVTTTGTDVPHGLATIKVTTANGTAAAGSDYTALGSTLTFAESDFSQVTIGGNTRYQASNTDTVSITQDTVDEDSETFTVSMASPSDSLISRDSAKTSATVTITDDDVHLSSLSVGDGTLTPAFAASTFSYTIPNVTYATSETTIMASAKSGVAVNFFDSKDATLPDLDDDSSGHQVALGIGDTTVKVGVTEGSLTQDYTLVFTRAKPTVSIETVTTSPAVEGDQIQFEISRSAAAADSFTIRVRADEVEIASGKGHGDILPSTHEDMSPPYYIDSGDTKTTITLDTTADTTWERHSKIEMKIVAADHFDIASKKGVATLIVKDDEFVASTAALSVSDNPVGEGAGSTTVTVTVTTASDKIPHGSATIQVTTANGTATAGSDYTALDSKLTFSESDFTQVTIGNDKRYRASETASVSITQDSIDDDAETFDVSMAAPSDSLIKRDSDATTVTVTITDDDDPIPIISTLSVGSGTLKPTFSSSTLSYTIPNVSYATNETTIEASAESEVTVSYLDSDGEALSDANTTKSGHQVALAIGNTTVKVRVAKGGQSQDYTLVFTRAKPTVEVRALTTTAATEGDVIEFELKRSAATGDALTISAVLEEVGVDANTSAGDHFPDASDGVKLDYQVPANNTTLTVRVSTTSDSAWERHSKLKMTIQADDSYTIAANKVSADVTVNDNDFPAATATLAVSPNPVFEGAGKTTATVTVTTSADRAPHAALSIPLSSTAGTATSGVDYKAVSSTLSFSPSDFTRVALGGSNIYRGTKSVDVEILADQAVEGSETFSLALGTPSLNVVTLDSATKTVTVTISNTAVTPTAAKGVTVSYDRTAGGLSVTWSAPDSDGGAAVSGYRVQWKPAPGTGCPSAGGWRDGSGPASGDGDKNGGCRVHVDSVDVSGLSHTITTHDGGSLTGDTVYDVRVAALNSVGRGAWSQVASGRVPANDATLTSLGLTPVGVETFSADVLDYDVTVGRYVTTTTVTATASDSSSTVAFGPDEDADSESPGHQAALAYGSNEITVTVTAEDGVSSNVYTVDVTRSRSNSNPVVYVHPDGAILSWCSGVRLKVASSDPENDQLTYRWTASSNIGHFVDANSKETLWVASKTSPWARSTRLTLTVSDGRGGRASDSVLVTTHPLGPLARYLWEDHRQHNTLWKFCLSVDELGPDR